jgi:hypothetical protein
MAGPRKVASTREPGRAFDILEPEAGVSDVYVDGFAGMTFSSSVTKVGLYLSVTPVQDNDVTVEQRIINIRLTMPTVNFVEMCISALKSMNANRTLIEQALAEQNSKIAS